MKAGPGRPVSAARKAARIISGSRSGWRTSALYFVIGRAISTRFVACHAPPRSGSVVRRRRVHAIAMIGCPSAYALVSPASMFAPPGPGLPMTTLGLRLMRVYPSARCTAPSS